MFPQLQELFLLKVLTCGSSLRLMSSKCTEKVHFLMEQSLLMIRPVRIQRKGIYLWCCCTTPRDELQAEVSVMDAQKE